MDLRRVRRVGAGIFAFFAIDILLQLTLGVSVWSTLIRWVGDAIRVLL